MLRILFFFSLITAAVLYGCGDAPEPAPAPPAAPASQTIAAPIIIADTFGGDGLDTALWEATSANDFREMQITVEDGRLKLRADTLGTDDATVKYLGIRSRQLLDISSGTTISFDLDWNEQANGCYLTAGLVLCPTATIANPFDEPDWLAFEYIGVPPGENARFQASQNRNGILRMLFTEGWPTEQRVGREISNQHVEVTMDGSRLSVTENGENLFSHEPATEEFTEAYIYLQMSSHSNYTSREIYFDNIEVRPARK